MWVKGLNREVTDSLLVTTTNIQLWTQNGNVVPMCWHLDKFIPNNDSRDDLRRAIEDSVADSWERVTNLKFTWEDCQLSQGATGSHVRIRLTNGHSETGGFGGHVDLLGMGSLQNDSEDDSTFRVTIDVPNNWQGQMNALHSFTRHEFGHLLGFYHEQDRHGATCTIGRNEGAYQFLLNAGAARRDLTPYDFNSIMTATLLSSKPGPVSAGYLRRKERLRHAAALRRHSLAHGSWYQSTGPCRLGDESRKEGRDPLPNARLLGSRSRHPRHGRCRR